MQEINSIELYNILNEFYPEKNNWPGENIWEIMVSAILVQNTTWHNTLMSLENIRQHHGFYPEALRQLNQEEWIELIRPSGFYQNKSSLLITWFNWLAVWDFDIKAVKNNFKNTSDLRKHFLSFKGIGPETADVMLLYPFQESAFIADSYARRLYTGLGGGAVAGDYQSLKVFVETTNTWMPVEDWQIFHIQILNFGKDYLRGKGPHSHPLFNDYQIQLT